MKCPSPPMNLPQQHTDNEIVSKIKFLCIGGEAMI